MSLRVDPGPIAKKIRIPGSKSYANRYLVLAARYGAGAVVENLPHADDVTLLVQALQAVGIKLKPTKAGWEFLNSFPECESSEGPLDINVGEGGTTGRFLLALLSTGKRTYRLHLAGRLSERPWSELIEALKSASVKVKLQDNIIEVQGPADRTRLPKTVSAARSTQFLSALQLAFYHDNVLFDGSQITASLPYWKMTVASYEQLEFNSIMTVPLDWSSAAYPICYAAVTGEVITLPGLRPDLHQADSALYELLKQRGAIRSTGGLIRQAGLEVRGLSDKRPIKMDLRHCPDLTPALAFLCAHLEGESVLEGLEALVHKESDRLLAIRDLLQSVGVKVTATASSLIIKGGLSLGPWKLVTPPDHRLVMTAALFLRAHQGGTLEHPECVQKSFPGFFSAMGF